MPFKCSRLWVSEVSEIKIPSTPELAQVLMFSFSFSYEFSDEKNEEVVTFQSQFGGYAFHDGRNEKH